MRYQNKIDFHHNMPTNIGVLLVNLGTPNSPHTADVRRYLKEFLSDPRLVEMPRPLWWLILHGIILRLRPRHSAKAYQKIWNTNGSPLLTISQQQTTALQSTLKQRGLNTIQVTLAMRYGQPSIPAGLASLRQAGAYRILILPLYPQYSATTTGSVFDAVTQELRTWRWVPELRFIHHYYDTPGYIQAIAYSIRNYWQEHGVSERLLFSFHGIPKAYSLAGDPYFHQCQKTANLIAEALNLNTELWQIAFQSRFGSQEWLTPYTNQQLQKWAQAGINKVHVITPGFATDCLETLDEIAIESKEHFLNAGGKEYGYIPALNATPLHIEALTDLIMQHLWMLNTDNASDLLDPQRG